MKKNVTKHCRPELAGHILAKLGLDLEEWDKIREQCSSPIREEDLTRGDRTYGIILNHKEHGQDFKYILGKLYCDALVEVEGKDGQPVIRRGHFYEFNPGSIADRLGMLTEDTHKKDEHIFPVITPEGASYHVNPFFTKTTLDRLVNACIHLEKCGFRPAYYHIDDSRLTRIAR